MNLLKAVYHAIEENSEATGDYQSYEAFKAFTVMINEGKNKINDFFVLLFGYSFSYLLNRCGGSILEPMTRSINIVWRLEDIKKIRADLTDKQASKVLETLLVEHYPLAGLDLNTVKLTCDKLYPN